MAFKIDLNVSGEGFINTSNGTIKTGIINYVAKDCYVKIEKIYGNKDNIVVEVSYEYNLATIRHESFSFVPILEAGNFIQQGYVFLKTLPEFIDSIDC